MPRRELGKLGYDLTRRLGATIDYVDSDKRRVLARVARRGVNAHNDVVAGDTGGDMHLSGVPGNVGATHKQFTDGMTVIKQYGPLHLISNDTGHPGPTRGKRTWQRGRKRAERLMTEMIGRETDRSLRKGFKR